LGKVYNIKILQRAPQNLVKKNSGGTKLGEGASGVAQMAECLPRKGKALSLNPSTTKRKKQKNKKTNWVKWKISVPGFIYKSTRQSSKGKFRRQDIM
jgi:hypothetical protein